MIGYRGAVGMTATRDQLEHRRLAGEEDRFDGVGPTIRGCNRAPVPGTGRIGEWYRHGRATFGNGVGPVAQSKLGDADAVSSVVNSGDNLLSICRTLESAGRDETPAGLLAISGQISTELSEPTTRE